MDSAGDVSASQVAGAVLRFVDQILLSLELALVEALAEHDLDLAEVRLLLAIDRGDREAAVALTCLDCDRPGLPGKLNEFQRRSLVREAPGQTGVDGLALSPQARQALGEIEDASRIALTTLVSGLDNSQRMRLQGAMHLLGDQLSTWRL